jgi:SAM-dependent methyltransferase
VIGTTGDDGRRLLCCPDCHGGLDWGEVEVRCVACGGGYPVVDGIAVFADPAGESGTRAAHKSAQVDFFEEEDEEFEISRPAGTTALYRWLIDEKHRRVMRGLEGDLAGRPALVVCGGSGMDAEYLARAGARVIVSDISLAAVRRARERSRRRGLAMLAVVADAEHLPIADAGVDLCWVHDGLHHLEDPMVGVAEMARASARYLCISEPARATATALAVRLGLALERETAGNRVERIDATELLDALAGLGFSVSHCERYAMYYRHRPGAASRLLSRPRLIGPVTAGHRQVNRVLGRIGNKLAVQAVRAP